jgi:hypothetical protein
MEPLHPHFVLFRFIPRKDNDALGVAQFATKESSNYSLSQ